MTTASPGRTPGLQGFDPRIEALRGVAALIVAAFHCGQTPFMTAGRPAGQLAFFGLAETPSWNDARAYYSWFLNGQGAVVLFFVVSGFVLSLSLDRMSGGGLRIAGLFLLRRVLRLLPPVAFMVAVFAIVYWTSGASLPDTGPADYSASSLLRHALLLETRIDGVAWTLQVEAFAAPIILLAWMAARRFGDIVLWGLWLLFCAMSYTSFVDDWLAAMGVPAQHYFQFMHAFVAGMLVPAWSRVLLRLRLPPPAAALYPIFGFALIFAAPVVLGRGSDWRVMAEMLGSVAVVTGVALGMTAFIGKVLDTKIVRFYGRISYSFYLLHALTLIWLWSHGDLAGRLVAAGIPPAVLAFAAFVASVLVVTPLAMLSYVVAEAPSVRLARRLGSIRPAQPMALAEAG